MCTDRPPGAAGARAQQIDADEERRRSRNQQDEIPGATIADHEGAELRRVNDNAGREAAPRFVFAAGVDHHEMQGERAHRQIKPAQPQRRQPEDNPEQSAHETRRRERHPERRVELTKQDARRERAGRNQSGVAERNLTGIAGEQHQGERADAGEKYLTGEIELEREAISGNASSRTRNTASHAA